MPEKQKLLVVEDDPVYMLFVTEVLNGSGKYLSIGAKNGREALDILGSDPEIKLVLSDIEMPEMNGFALLKTVRKSGNKIPFLMLTSQDQPENGAASLTLGATGYLVKGLAGKTDLLAEVGKYAG
jgi:CheY-like chemotaxis protein